MRNRSWLIVAAFVAGATVWYGSSFAQERGRGAPGGAGGSAQELVERFLAFDKTKSGKVKEADVTDDRFLRVFTRADKNNDGVVTREEIEAFAKEAAAQAGAGFPGGERKGDFGKGKGGKGGEGGRFGFGPPQPGAVLPGFLRERLNLTDEQKKRVDDLQKDVESKLNAILTPEQRKTLTEMRERGPGFGPGGGFPGRGPGGEGERKGEKKRD